MDDQTPPTKNMNTMAGAVSYNSTDIVSKLVDYWISQTPHTSAPDDLELAIRRLSDAIDTRFRREINQLPNVAPIVTQAQFNAVVDALFRKGGINWGRIIMLLMFTGALARWFTKNEMTDQVESVIGWSSTRIEGLLPWINTHGGWEKLIEYSKDRKTTWSSPTPIRVLCAIGVMTFGAYMFLTY